MDQLFTDKKKRGSHDDNFVIQDHYQDGRVNIVFVRCFVSELRLWRQQLHMDEY